MTIWRESKNWTYEYFDLNSDPSTFGGFEDFVRFWQMKRDDRIVPTRFDYDWYEIQQWWGSMIMVDYTYDPFDFTYRLFGTKVVDSFGFDATNRSASAMWDPKYDTAHEMEFYEFVATNLLIARTSGQLIWAGREHVHASFIELPLSTNGQTADHAIALML